MARKQAFTLARIISASVITVIIYLVPIEGYSRILAYCVPYLIAGYDVIWEAARNIFRGRVFDEHFLMSIATAGAFCVGEYPEAAGVMIFYQIGELFQSAAEGKSRGSIASLMALRPDHASVLRGGREITVSPRDVAPGETVIVRQGEKIPLDGEILSGETSVNTSALTGESVPEDKAAGDAVQSGTVNLGGLIKVKVLSAYEDSTVEKILQLVENSSAKKAGTENIITRFSRCYTPAVVAAAVLLAAAGPLIFDGEPAEWIRRALIFLMVSCPCALLVSVPLAFFTAIGRASRDGVLIKGANFIEALARADAVVLDKTGTLTKGTFSVNAIHPKDISEADLLDIAAAAESYSTHPAGASITAAHEGHIDTSRIGRVNEIAGKGVRAEIDGEVYYVGSGALMDAAGADWHPCHLSGTVIHISRADAYLGHIVISDELKPDAKEAVERLRRLGIKKTVMLTGDGEKAAREIAAGAGIEEYRAGLLPSQKVEEIEKLRSGGYRAVFAGDGINDAPALAEADVGIAMGALGSDAAIESADVVLMDDRLIKLPFAVGIARSAMRTVKQNIIFVLAVKAAILILAALGLTNMWTAVFGDVGVMILAILNSMKMLLGKPREERTGGGNGGYRTLLRP